MSNSCKMPLKSYVQCVRNSECFRSDPRDNRMDMCAKTPEVEEECASFLQIYRQCKLDTVRSHSGFS